MNTLQEDLDDPALLPNIIDSCALKVTFVLIGRVFQPERSVYLYAAGCWLTSRGVPFLFQVTSGVGIPAVSQLSTALIPVLGLIFVPLDVGRGVTVRQALQGQMSINRHCECPHVTRAVEGRRHVGQLQPGLLSIQQQVAVERKRLTVLHPVEGRGGDAARLAELVTTQVYWPSWDSMAFSRWRSPALSPRAEPSRSACPPRVYVDWGPDTMAWLSFNQVMLGAGEPSTSQGRTVGKPSTTDTSEVSPGPLMKLHMGVSVAR
ncbi:hypothetical protein EYF80_003311 [Liparis tanakae]|uniref:Uncharacterized protein n=1 Tax=Liparis tanakae TaxID=230148 RepID=A0A4Z2J9F0_9TELE|nr:hypothetical protein EYF80_003311 [Liparis tanakae]